MPESLRAFYASPFAPEYRWLREAVATSCRQHDVELRVVDEIVQPGANIVQSIHREIDTCDFAVAVLTGNNPNVYYELGRLFQGAKPTILLASQEGIAALPFDVRTFAVLKYDADTKDVGSVADLVGSAIGRIRLSLDPETRERNLHAETVQAADHSVLAIDFEQIRRDAEQQLGKSGCKTVDIQNHDTDSFKGWNQTLECPCGDIVVIVIDLNGDVKRVRVR